MVDDDLTTTSYAILGLLAVKPWTTYELAKQMGRSLRSFWPRAESRIYEEPKRLVAKGLAKATVEQVGRRPRTVYAITAKGRRALAGWLGRPGSGAPQLEFEALVKVFFSEHGTKDGALAQVAAIRRWADERTEENIRFARLYLEEDGGPFPDRLAQIVLIGRFLTDFTDMVGAWADWAAEVVGGWPASTGAEPDWATLEAVRAKAVPGGSRSTSP